MMTGLADLAKVSTDSISPDRAVAAFLSFVVASSSLPASSWPPLPSSLLLWPSSPPTPWLQVAAMAANDRKGMGIAMQPTPVAVNQERREAGSLKISEPSSQPKLPCIPSINKYNTF